jgi:hypothetical protein
MLGDAAVLKGVLGVTVNTDGADVWPSTFVTVIWAAPIGKAGARQLMVALGETKRVTAQFTPAAVVLAALLKSTVAPGSKSVPVMMRGTPPASGPVAVESDVIAGAEKVGGVCPAARNATICITQMPDVRVAVAL